MASLEDIESFKTHFGLSPTARIGLDARLLARASHSDRLAKRAREGVVHSMRWAPCDQLKALTTSAGETPARDSIPGPTAKRPKKLDWASSSGIPKAGPQAVHREDKWADFLASLARQAPPEARAVQIALASRKPDEALRAFWGRRKSKTLKHIGLVLKNVRTAMGSFGAIFRDDRADAHRPLV